MHSRGLKVAKRTNDSSLLHPAYGRRMAALGASKGYTQQMKPMAFRRFVANALHDSPDIAANVRACALAHSGPGSVRPYLTAAIRVDISGRVLQTNPQDNLIASAPTTQTFVRAPVDSVQLSAEEELAAKRHPEVVQMKLDLARKGKKGAYINLRVWSKIHQVKQDLIRAKSEAAVKAREEAVIRQHSTQSAATTIEPAPSYCEHYKVMHADYHSPEEALVSTVQNAVRVCGEEETQSKRARLARSRRDTTGARTKKIEATSAQLNALGFSRRPLDESGSGKLSVGWYCDVCIPPGAENDPKERWIKRVGNAKLGRVGLYTTKLNALAGAEYHVRVYH